MKLIKSKKGQTSTFNLVSYEEILNKIKNLQTAKTT